MQVPRDILRVLWEIFRAEGKSRVKSKCVEGEGAKDKLKGGEIWSFPAGEGSPFPPPIKESPAGRDRSLYSCHINHEILIHVIQSSLDVILKSILSDIVIIQNWFL